MSRTLPRLSIITPVMNGAAHIELCLNNVRDQEQEETEHVIVDGGSTDGTLEIIRERMQSDPRVRLVEGPDRGQSHAMNKGVVSARGAILGTLNVDDRYKPGAFALALESLHNTTEPAFFWGACEVDDHIRHRVWVQYPGNFVTWRMARGWAFEPHPINPVAYFYHRSLHLSAGLYDENEHYALDLDFLLRAPQHVRQTVVTRTILGTYYLAPGTKTFADNARGTNVARAQAVYQKAMDQLNVADRIRYEASRKGIVKGARN